MRRIPYLWTRVFAAQREKFSMPLDGNSSDGCHGMWDLNPDFEQSKIIIGFTRKRQHERAASANTTQLATFYQR